MCLLGGNKRANWLGFQTICVQVLFVSGIPHSSERHWSQYFDVLCAAYVDLPINSCFVYWLFFFCLNFIKFMKQEQKLSLLFTQKRMTVEPENQEDGLDKDGEAGEIH